MPQASEELRAIMRKRFGSIDDHGPSKFLVDAGFKLTRTWCWYRSNVQSYADLKQEERECIIFLVHEWDYGGLEFFDSSLKSLTEEKIQRIVRRMTLSVNKP